MFTVIAAIQLKVLSQRASRTTFNIWKMNTKNSNKDGKTALFGYILVYLGLIENVMLRCPKRRTRPTPRPHSMECKLELDLSMAVYSATK